MHDYEDEADQEEKEEYLDPDYSVVYVDPLEIIEKYKDGLTNDSRSKQVDNTWRSFFPSFLKKKIPGWKTLPVEEVYNLAKMELKSTAGEKYNQLFSYICDLSEIVFNEKEEDDEVPIDLMSDETAEAILKLVEIIILPHQEVLARIEESGGRIQFVNVWETTFSENLKKEIKDRDGWKCVICEGQTDLHVHHKIPRNLGGMNHKDNLVTLCNSCHPAIETANVQVAFKKCLANFRKNKASGKITDAFSEDKRQLKDEVETTLDKVLESLLIREENQLAEQLAGVMKRLEIIFYD